ncbi:nitroreductase [Blastocystis sp. subtype 4]|uniref:nitroreductase n=1 Tax=Blastocystis sp. subtype 4 TaxID=944170 RepID=UPI0007117410|nr:nitroreductase [Blastocystis sp. subtype 4]KNB43385.1 nitroreductase [Blastocystis sp. subtype 4]|eukprot:XP_014526822.1 nitroreductase [Blastocystis sp. subtype 4]
MEKIILCPNAGNQQLLKAYYIYAVTNRSKIEAICKASGQGWVQQAPLLFVFCCECKDHFYGRRGLELYALQDATIAQTYAVLACQEEGLSSFSESEVSSILQIPSHLRPVGILPCGYSTANPRHERTRKEVSDTFTLYKFCVSS